MLTDTNRKTSIIAYYLSKYNRDAIHALGYDTYTSAFYGITARFGKSHNYIKLPLSVAVPELAIDEKKYYFSERAVQGMKNAKNNMKRGLAQDLNEPCLTVTSHLAKVSLNSRDPVLLVDPERELYRRFTPREAARVQSFPDTFEFVGNEQDAYRQIGNAVPPVMFWHIANAVSKQLSECENPH